MDTSRIDGVKATEGRRDEQRCKFNEPEPEVDHFGVENEQRRVVALRRVFFSFAEVRGALQMRC